MAKLTRPSPESSSGYRRCGGWWEEWLTSPARAPTSPLGRRDLNWDMDAGQAYAWTVSLWRFGELAMLNISPRLHRSLTTQLAGALPVAGILGEAPTSIRNGRIAQKGPCTTTDGLATPSRSTAITRTSLGFVLPRATSGRERIDAGTISVVHPAPLRV